MCWLCQCECDGRWSTISTLLVPVLSSLQRHAETIAEVHQCTGTCNDPKLPLPNTRIQIVVVVVAAVSAEKNARLPLLQGCFQVRHLAVELVLWGRAAAAHSAITCSCCCCCWFSRTPHATPDSCCCRRTAFVLRRRNVNAAADTAVCLIQSADSSEPYFSTLHPSIDRSIQIIFTCFVVGCITVWPDW